MWVEMSSFNLQNSQIFILRARYFAKEGIVRPPIIHTYQRKGKRGNVEKGVKDGGSAKLVREGGDQL